MKPVQVPNQERTLSEDAHAADLSRVVSRVQRAAHQRLEVEIRLEVERHIAIPDDRCAFPSASRPAVERRSLEVGYAGSSLDRKLGLLNSYDVRGYRPKPAFEYRDFVPDPLGVSDNNVKETSCMPVAAVASVLGPSSVLSPRRPPVITPSAGAHGGGRGRLITHLVGRGRAACAAPGSEGGHVVAPGWRKTS